MPDLWSQQIVITGLIINSPCKTKGPLTALLARKVVVYADGAALEPYQRISTRNEECARLLAQLTQAADVSDLI